MCYTDPGGTSGKKQKQQQQKKKTPANIVDIKDMRFNSWIRKFPLGRKWQPTPAFLPGESHGQRSLAGYSLLGHKESDMTEAT